MFTDGLLLKRVVTEWAQQRAGSPIRRRTRTRRRASTAPCRTSRAFPISSSSPSPSSSSRSSRSRRSTNDLEQDARLRAHDDALLARRRRRCSPRCWRRGPRRRCASSTSPSTPSVRTRSARSSLGYVGVLAVQHRRHDHQRLGPHAADDGHRRRDAGSDGGGGVDRHPRRARPRRTIRCSSRRCATAATMTLGLVLSAGYLWRTFGAALPLRDDRARRGRPTRRRWRRAGRGIARGPDAGQDRHAGVVRRWSVVVYLVVCVVTGELRPSELKRLRAKK